MFDAGRLRASGLLGGRTRKSWIAALLCSASGKCATQLVGLGALQIPTSVSGAVSLMCLSRTNAVAVGRKVRLLSKPEPSHVGATGRVVLKAVFGSSGKVTRIEVVSGVPGLTEEAIKAARKITFDPAIKDGRYVAMWMQLEYNFF